MSGVRPPESASLLDVSHLLQRKGAARISAITPEVLGALNQGRIATVNLVEFLAIDLHALTVRVARDIGLNAQAERIQDTLAMLGAFKPMQRHGHIARALYDTVRQLPDTAQRDAAADALARHPSDMARCWAANWLSFSGQTLSEKLTAVARFAADAHFGVREMAWSALRNDVIAQLDDAIVMLQGWTVHPDANMRRFATEITRPRGVWCAQIEALKAAPWRALTLLEPLRQDPSRYVQDSVANWLNDASKSQPSWVTTLCAQWERESDCVPTRYIVQRAQRTLRKGR